MSCRLCMLPMGCVDEARGPEVLLLEVRPVVLLLLVLMLLVPAAEVVVVLQQLQTMLLLRQAMMVEPHLLEHIQYPKQNQLSMKKESEAPEHFCSCGNQGE